MPGNPITDLNSEIIAVFRESKTGANICVVVP